MEVAVEAGLPAEGDMYVNAGHVFRSKLITEAEGRLACKRGYVYKCRPLSLRFVQPQASITQN